MGAFKYQPDCPSTPDVLKNSLMMGWLVLKANRSFVILQIQIIYEQGLQELHFNSIILSGSYSAVCLPLQMRFELLKAMGSYRTAIMQSNPSLLKNVAVWIAKLALHADR